jgi:hypothetical protein
MQYYSLKKVLSLALNLCVLQSKFIVYYNGMMNVGLPNHPFKSLKDSKRTNVVFSAILLRNNQQRRNVERSSAFLLRWLER